MQVALAETEPAVSDGPDGGDIAGIVGENLRKIRTRQGLSLERLAKISGVSRAMLGQIELGRSAPTINLLWKISRALDVPLNVFVSRSGSGQIRILRSHRAKWISSGNGRYSARVLSPADGAEREEVREIRIAPQSMEEEEAHPVGTIEQLVVVKGVLEVRINMEWHRLEKGDSARISADHPHAYRNPGPEETQVIMVIVHPIGFG